MTDFILPVSCASCGANVEPVASSTLRSQPATETTAVVRCGSCRRQWVVVVHLRPGPKSDSPRARRAS